MLEGDPAGVGEVGGVGWGGRVMWRSVGAGRAGRAFVGVGVRVGERGEGGGEGCTGIHVFQAELVGSHWSDRWGGGLWGSKVVMVWKAAVAVWT